MSTHISSNHAFKKGDKIEVLRNADDGNIPVWFPATILDSPSPAATLHVKYNTLSVEREGKEGRRKRKKIREYVDGVTRPVPPAVCGWGKGGGILRERMAEVKDVLEDFEYRVVIDGSVDAVVENLRIRVSHNWKPDDGSWVSSTVDPQQKRSCQLILQSRKGTKLRIICTSKTPAFQKGTPVEVRSHEEGYYASWYPATIVGPTNEQNKLTVQYSTLTDDELQPLVETAFDSNVRPIPPIINRIDRFKMLEEVDAWCNDGWWVGVIKVVKGLKYVVYFWTSNEEMEFEHSKLRSHQELVYGKWVASFLRPKLTTKPKLEKVKLHISTRTTMVGLLIGLKVEISHGEQGFLTTWYPAVILGPVCNETYLVEYRTLNTSNGPQLMKEEVDVLCIRPCPPIIQRPDCFQMHDKVEAWEVNGWRIGQICRIMKDFKYEVCFRATNTVGEFNHEDLRPRQNFVDGAWLLAPTDIP